MSSAISDMFKNIYLCPDVLFNILCNNLFLVTLNIYMFDDNRHFASWSLHYNLPLTSMVSSGSYSSIMRSCSLIAYFTVLLVSGIHSVEWQNDRRFRRKKSWSNEGTVSQFSWSVWEKSLQISIRIAHVLTEIRTRTFRIQDVQLISAFHVACKFQYV
jgi:hypothetical protein